jgi:hypothetical protein
MDVRKQLLGQKRLWQESVSARFEALDFHLRVVLCGHSENQRIMLGTQVTARRKCVYTGHRNVENNQVWLMGFPGRANAIGCECEVHGVAPCPQPPRQHLHHVTVRIDD